MSVYTFTGIIIESDGSYRIPISYTQIVPGVYTIVSVATLAGLEELWTYETYIGIDCPVIDGQITLAQDAFREHIVDLANEVVLLRQREYSSFTLPHIFLPT